MNFLKKTIVDRLKTLVALVCLTLTISAQDLGPADEGKKYGQPGFEGEPINLNVVNADIRDILNYITEQYGVNFVIDGSVGQVPITVNVKEVPWNVALDALLRAQSLGVDVNGPILRIAQYSVLISESEAERKSREDKLYSSPLVTEFIRLNYSRASTSSGGTEGAGGQTASSGASGGGGGQILAIIQRRLSSRGSIEIDGRSNTLIITDVEENIEAIRKLVFYLDRPEPQVEIEARIVVANRAFTRDLGVQLSAIAINPSRLAAGIVSTLPGQINNSARGAITSSGGGGGQGGDGGQGGGNQGGGVPGSPPPGAGMEITPPNGNLGAVANTVIGLTTGVFGTARINALLTLSEEKGNVKTIATPRVTTLNNRKAEITSGQQIPVTNVQPGGGQGAIVTTTQYIDVPLRLTVTPQITNVGSVILDVEAENSSIPPSVGAGVAPTIATQEVQTEVVVPDGGTTIIGGAVFDTESEVKRSTPGLSKIPIIGNLFKRKRTERTTAELLFFITPRIYRPDYIGKPVSDKEVDKKPKPYRIRQPVPLGNPPSNSDAQEKEGDRQGGDKQDAPPAQNDRTGDKPKE